MTMRVLDTTPARTPAAATDDELATLMLDQEGRIRDCNAPAEALFGFHHDELVAQPIDFLMPQLKDIEWFQNGGLNPHLSFVCHIGRQFNAVRRDGSLFASRLFFHDLGNGKTPHLRLIIRRAENMG